MKKSATPKLTLALLLILLTTAAGRGGTVYSAIGAVVAAQHVKDMLDQAAQAWSRQASPASVRRQVLMMGDSS